MYNRNYLVSVNLPFFLDVLIELRGTFLSALSKQTEHIYELLNGKDLTRTYLFEKNRPQVSEAAVFCLGILA